MVDEFWRKAVKIWTSENLIQYVENDLDRKIKRDRAVKLSVFFTGLSAYLPEPINLFLKGESGIGKTYNAVKTLEYFPKDDVWHLIGLTPKALAHGYGVLVNKNGEPINLNNMPKRPRKRDYKTKEEYEEALEEYRESLREWVEELKDSYRLINLRGKILLFLEAPSLETFRMLYPILSHDVKMSFYKYTDRDERTKKLKQETACLEGWCSAIFLSVDKQYLEEMATRSFTATPEASKEKIMSANELTNLKASYPFIYNQELESTKIIKHLIENIKKAFLENNLDVIVPFPQLYTIFPSEIVRDMRDFNRFIQFLKTVTALHLFQRPFIHINGTKYLVSNVDDIKNALSLYLEIFETTRTGTEERILKFYHDIVAKGDNWTIQELTTKYNERADKKVSSETIRRWLRRLSEIGYVDVEPSAEDKRMNCYSPLVKEEKSTICQKMKDTIILTSNLLEGFKKWLNEFPQNVGEQNNIKFSKYKILDEEKGVWGETEISFEEFVRDVLGEYAEDFLKNVYILNGAFCGYLSKEENAVKNEVEDKNIRNKDFCQIVDNSTEKKQEIGISEEAPKEVDEWNNAEWFEWKRIKPNEPCELCGSYPTEYLIHIKEWGTTLRRCERCFNDFRKMFQGGFKG